jgi:Ni,Fe-hydrogenase I cytochrome b subunit
MGQLLCIYFISPHFTSYRDLHTLSMWYITNFFCVFIYVNISDIVFFVGFFYDIFYMRFMLQQKKIEKKRKTGPHNIHNLYIYLMAIVFWWVYRTIVNLLSHDIKFIHSLCEWTIVSFSVHKTLCYIFPEYKTERRSEKLIA